MANIGSNTSFCEECPFANGIIEATGLIGSESGAVAPNPGMKFAFKDAKGNMSHEVTTRPTGDYDSTMFSATAASIVDSIENCSNPQTVQKRRLRGLLGTVSTQQCGAFPGQNPRKPVINASSNGWAFEDYGW